MNPLYNRLMAEKGAPRAANNPNTTQLRGAPMNLRSAMQKYAIGGGVGSPPPSAGDINSFVQANIGNPQAIMQAAQQYGVSMDDLANATGYSSSQIDDYFGNAGLGSFGTKPTPPSVQGYAPVNLPPRPITPDESMFVPKPSSIPQTVMPNEGLNEPELNFGGKTTSQPYDYGDVPKSEQSNIANALKMASNPPQGGSSSGSTIPPGFAEAITRQLSQGNVNPFGTEITQQDQIMKLLQSLGMK